MSTQLTLFSETQKRDSALDLVLGNAGATWRERAVAMVRAMPAGEVTGEDIRLACEAEGIEAHHPNAWGAFTNSLIREGLLVPTGRYTAMKAEGSHARKTQVYRLAHS